MILNMEDGILTPSNVECGTIMRLISPGDCSLHTAIWHVALGSWQWIHQVAAPCNATRSSGITCHWIRQTFTIMELYFWFRFRPYQRSRHVILHQSANFYPNRTTHLRQKKITSCRFSRWRISAILDFRGPIIGSLKSPRTTWSSIRDHSSKLFSFWENRVIVFWRQKDKQTDRRTDGQACCDVRTASSWSYQ